MKKLVCFIVCAVIILNLVGECSFAGMDPIFHVYIANVEKMIGGNNRTSFTPVDTLKGYSDKEHFAYMKYVLYREYPNTIGEGRTLKPQGSGVKKQANKIPTEKTGLINPKNPIDIVSYSDRVLFGFNMEYQGDYVAKILDSKGKVLASVSEGTSIYPNQNKGFAEVKVSSQADKYYIELINGDKEPTEYFYILLTMKATDVKAERSAKYVQIENDRQKEYDNYTSVEQAYMKKHGITNRESLTDKDMGAIADELRKKQFEENDVGSSTDMMSALPEEYKKVLIPYMKKHGISSTKDLTTEDWMNLAPELKKLQNKSKGTNKKRK